MAKINKKKGKVNRSVTSELNQTSGNEMVTQPLLDNRPETIAQLKLQKALEDSALVKQLKSSIKLASKSPKAKKVTQLLAMADNFRTQKKSGNTTSLRKSASINDSGFENRNISDLPIQLEREYDGTLSEDKSNLMNWLIDSNRTLGISTEGTSSSREGRMKENFSWHHIMPFAELKQHGEKKSDPANHGENVRLGPGSKNRNESSDVSGGMAIDYSYLPQDKEGNIVLDAISKKIFDGELTADNKSSFGSHLDPKNYKSTPQSEHEGNHEEAFREWFLSEEHMDEYLSEKLIISALAEAKDSVNKEEFANAVKGRLKARQRTYKYYNKKKNVISKTGIPMSDISAGNFDDITAERNEKDPIKASEIIHALLSGNKWVSRGSQGVIQDLKTTYKFGISKWTSFAEKIKDAVKDLDLGNYQTTLKNKFNPHLEKAFKEKLGNSKSDTFKKGNLDAVIKKLDDKFKSGVAGYDVLWEDVKEVDCKGLYSKSKISESDDQWNFPIPSREDRLKALSETKKNDDVLNAWLAVFAKELEKWDGSIPLLPYEVDESQIIDIMNIDFKNVTSDFMGHEGKLTIEMLNEARETKKNSKLPKTFIQNLDLQRIKNVVADAIHENGQDTYLNNEMEEMQLSEIKEGMQKGEDGIESYMNILNKKLKGIDKDYSKRNEAFQGAADAYVNQIKWTLLNKYDMPTSVEGTAEKQWDQLGDLQKDVYEKWNSDNEIDKKIAALVKSEDFIKMING